MYHRTKPDGRYSSNKTIEQLVDEWLIECDDKNDEWDDITATESPVALTAEPRGKRSGEYLRAELLRALQESKIAK
jgi:hypothetical protein